MTEGQILPGTKQGPIERSISIQCCYAIYQNHSWINTFVSDAKDTKIHPFTEHMSRYRANCAHLAGRIQPCNPPFTTKCLSANDNQFYCHGSMGEHKKNTVSFLVNIVCKL